MSGYGMDLPKSTNVNTNYTPAKAQENQEKLQKQILLNNLYCHLKLKNLAEIY